MTTPTVRAVLPAPRRGDPEDVFESQAADHLGSLVGFSADLDVALPWMREQVTATGQNATAAASSAGAAATSRDAATVQAAAARLDAEAAKAAAGQVKGDSGTAALERQSAQAAAATATNQGAAAASSAATANAALLALGNVLANGIGMFSVDADGNLSGSYNSPTVSSLAINAAGDLIVTY